MSLPASDPSRSLLEQAKFLVERKRYTEALKILSRAMGIDPEFHDVYCQMSASLEGLERFDEALEAAEGAVRNEPDGGLRPSAARSISCASLSDWTKPLKPLKNRCAIALTGQKPITVGVSSLKILIV